MMTSRVITIAVAATGWLALASSTKAEQVCPTGQSRTCVQRTRMQPVPNTLYTCNTHLKSCQRSAMSKDVPVTDTVCSCLGKR